MKKSPVALVMGSSRGIGRCIAIKLHKDGYNVVVTYCYDKKAGETVFDEIDKKGLLMQLDGGDEDSVRKAVKTFKRKYDHLDALIVSGMRDIPKDFKHTTLKDWNFVIKSKLTSSFLVPKMFYPLLKNSNNPTIVLNTSDVERHPQVGALAYSVTSAGVANLTKYLSLELAPEGIRVNAICPGTTRTDNWKGFGLEDDEMWDNFAKNNPMRRVPTPEDIAEAVSYLVSDKAKYINGLFLYVDGGNRHSC